MRVPDGLSLLATDSFTRPVAGITELPAADVARYGPGDYVPNVPVLYWAFRLMMGLGMGAVGVGVLGLWLTRRGRLPAGRWIYRLATLGLPAALAAAAGGWVLTEIGRQPWTVVGELLTAASVSPGVSLVEVAVSLAVLTALYGALAVVEARLLWRYVQAGPEPVGPDDSDNSDAPTPALAY